VAIDARADCSAVAGARVLKGRDGGVKPGECRERGRQRFRQVTHDPTQAVDMATAPNRREVFLDHGRVFIEIPRLMTDDELADVLAAFVAEIKARPPKPSQPPEERSRPVRKFLSPRPR
jgi:hypothetical protein